MGLACTSDLNEGDFVASYVGELYHSKDAKWKKKEKEYSRNGNDGRYYTMRLTGGFIIDAY